MLEGFLNLMFRPDQDSIFFLKIQNRPFTKPWILIRSKHMEPNGSFTLITDVTGGDPNNPKETWNMLNTFRFIYFCMLYLDPEIWILENIIVNLDYYHGKAVFG